MRWRALLLSGLFAASLGLGFTSSASADPPPWAGRWSHNKHFKGGGHDDHYDHWRHDGDYWRRDRDWRHDGWRDDASWRWRHDDDWRRRDDAWRWRRDHDHDWWRRDNRQDPYGYRGNYRGSGYSAACGERIARDRAKIAEIGPSGRHRKALRWFQDDLNNAMRDGC